MSSPPSSSFPAAVLLPAQTDGTAKEPFFVEGEVGQEEEASAAADERSK